MGKSSFEASLRLRVVACVLPALVAIGVAAVGITAKVLASADEDAAHKRAAALATSMTTELSEGDSFAFAGGEVLDGLVREHAEGLVRRASEVRSTPDVPVPLAELRPGTCDTVTVAGATWTWCAAIEGDVETVAALRVDEHRAAVRRLATWMALVVVVALALVLLMLRSAMKPPVRSLSQLAHWADTLKTLEGPRKPAPAASHVEIERLSRAFETLVDRLLDALTRERAVSGHIAHELRTPLAALRADLDSLQGDKDAMRKDIERLDRVIEAILVLSAPKPESAPADVVNVADVAREVAPKGVDVQAPDEALVSADARLVELALSNLLENADKHGGGPRRIEVRREGARACVAVLDEGPGVKEADLPKMFERYWRGTADGPGSGIGLAFVRAVAERYGGEARAKARDGGGLEVIMTLGPVLDWQD